MTPVASLWVLSRRGAPTAKDPERPVGLPLEGFTEKADAEEAQKKLERAAREQAPIGQYLRQLIPKRANELVAAAQAAGLPPPDFTAAGPEVQLLRRGNTTTYTPEYSQYCAELGRAVASWWASVSADLTPEANAALWDALFPEHHFYAITRALFEP